jgi:hypothetical protein
MTASGTKQKYPTLGSTSVVVSKPDMDCSAPGGRVTVPVSQLHFEPGRIRGLSPPGACAAGLYAQRHC